MGPKVVPFEDYLVGFNKELLWFLRAVSTLRCHISSIIEARAWVPSDLG